MTNLISDDNGDKELKKAEEWLAISKNLNYEPPKISSKKSDSSIGIGDVIDGVAAIGEVAEGVAAVAGVIGYAIYGICSLIFDSGD